ncbi:MAG: hypothetical protein LQ342_006179 [Letrouitia transgressa]|nr:MAG: hypothetical protein LQ342_006179 [Letrouitia transgressa]
MANTQHIQFCASSDCPAKGIKHLLGLYIHNNQPGPNILAHPRFGLSNPPPSVWATRERIIQERASLGDYIAVIAFNHYHGVDHTSEDGLAESLLAKEEEEKTNEVDMDDPGWTAAESAEVQAQLEQAVMDLDIEEAEEQTRKMTILEREKEEGISRGRGGVGLSADDFEALAIETWPAEMIETSGGDLRVMGSVGEQNSEVDDVVD